MNTDKFTRDELVFHLFKGNAHMTFEEAVSDFPVKKMNELFTNGDYTFWHLLEHIRRTQNDILDFITNPDYKEREWPRDYWPARIATPARSAASTADWQSVAGGPGKNEKATKKDWDETISAFLKDRKKLQQLVENPKTDLYKKIPHGTGQTIFREIIVIVDHTAYHLGEFAIMRQALNAWGNNQK